MNALKILIIKLSAIGDVVQTLPAVEAIKKLYPASEITWVVEEAAAGILEGHPAIDRILVSRRKTWFRQLRSPGMRGQGFAAIRQFLRDLRRDRFDIAIDFQGLFKSGMLIGLARAKRKIGFAGGRELSSFFLNERLPAYDIERHALERYLDIARYLGAVDPAPTCDLAMEEEKQAIARRLAAVRRLGQPLMVLNPMARWKTKLWTEEGFARLADRLVREKGALVILTGSSADRAVNDRIQSLMQEQAQNWAGETTLKELAALAVVADAFITTDTGPMHIAAAAGARVVALFGPTAPNRTGPYGPGNRSVRTGAECSPCFRRDCDRGMVCMTGIRVDDVMETLEDES